MKNSANDPVDNIYVGHSAADAKKFASETFHVKKPIEKELEGSDSDEIEIEAKTLVEKVQLKVYEFIRRSSFSSLSPTTLSLLLYSWCIGMKVLSRT